LPVLAQRELGGGPEAFGLLVSGLGVGAVLGGLVTARKGWIGVRTVALGCLVAAGALILLAVSPTIALGIAAMVLFGMANITLLTTANSTVQLAAGPALQGRLIALYAAANVGSTSMGAPVIGWLCDVVGARSTLGIAAGAAGLICAYGLLAHPRLDRGRAD
jgi:MFS family permease